MNRFTTQPAQLHQPRFLYSRGERVGFFMIGGLLACLLMIAAWLKPDPAGMGTHTQLGLPGCSMFTFLGIRCPGCGMTTSWAYVMNGNLESAIRANLGGVLLCFIAVVASPLLLCIAFRGKPISNGWVAPLTIISLVAAIVISFIEWLFRLAF